MDQTSSYSSRNFIISATITAGVGLYLILTSFIIGKNEFFLLLNNNLGTGADYFFRFWTNMGDGIIWVIVAIIFFLYQKNKLPLLIAVIVFSTLLTQLTKNFVFPGILRPVAAIPDIHLIHSVPGVELLSANSFPSGHTATAFSIYLLACLFIRSSWVIPAGFVYAILVGYSRIYLAQHFPLDVGAGMITALLTLFISLFIQQQWEKRKPQV